MAKNPNYSGELDYAPTFKYGGRTWGEGDKAKFEKLLRRRGIKPGNWYRNHPTAAKSFDPIEAQISGMLQPQITGIEYERKKQRENDARLRRDLTGFSAALAPFLQGIGPNIRGAYGEGAETMGALGTGYGSVLNESMQASANVANDTLGNIGAPEGQMIQAGDSGSVLAGLAGWIPQTLMGQEGKAYGSAADQLPHTASLQQGLMMKDLISDSRESEEDFSTEILKILQGAPSLRQELRGQAADRRAAKSKDEFDRLMKLAALAAAKGDDKRSNAYLKLAQDKQKIDELESQGLDPSGNPRPGYYRHKGGRILKDGTTLNKKGEVVKLYKPNAPGKPGSKDEWTPTQKKDQLKDVAASKDDIKDAIIEAIQADEWDVHDMGPPAPGKSPKKQRKALFDKLFAEFTALAGAATPEAKRALKVLINRMLHEAAKAPAGSNPSTPSAPSGGDGPPLP